MSQLKNHGDRKTLRAFQDIDTILAYSASASSIKLVAFESFYTFPEMAVRTFVRSAGILLLLHTFSTTTERIFAGPLRRNPNHENS